MNQINDKCTLIAKHFESLHDGDLSLVGLQPKMCPAGIWTEGYGNAIIDPQTGKFLRGQENKYRAYLLSDIYDEPSAATQLEKNLVKYSAQTAKVCDSLNMKFSDEKFSALVSFAYNLGTGALRNMLTSYKNGIPIEKAFLMYRFATVDGVKTELPGLIRRRKSEAWLFTTGTVKLYF
jgi:lysozyme